MLTCVIVSSWAWGDPLSGLLLLLSVPFDFLLADTRSSSVRCGLPRASATDGDGT